MFCTKCGKEIVENAHYCSCCGLSQQDTSIVKGIHREYLNKKEKSDWDIGEVIFAIGLLAVIVTLGYWMIKMNTIEGSWYQVNQWDGNGPETYFNFMADGTFIGDGNSGGTYSAQRGDLFLQYHPLVGNRSYEYEIKWGKLYIYSNGGYSTYEYSRVKPEGWRDGSVTVIELDVDSILE